MTGMLEKAKEGKIGRQKIKQNYFVEPSGSQGKISQQHIFKEKQLQALVWFDLLCLAKFVKGRQTTAKIVGSRPFVVGGSCNPGGKQTVVGSNESEINKSFSTLFDEDDIENRVYKSFTYYEAYKV